MDGAKRDSFSLFSLAVTCAESAREVGGLLIDLGINLTADVISDAARWAWKKYQWWSKGKTAESAIEALNIYNDLTTEQQTVLKQLPKWIKKHKSRIRKETDKKSINEVLASLLVEEGFDDSALALDMVTTVIDELCELTAHSVTRMEVYRKLMSHDVILRDLLELSMENEARITTLAQIGLEIQDLFHPLGRLLDQDIVLRAYRNHLKDNTRVLPEPRFFRRPRASWIDFSERAVYIRNNVVAYIEESFSETNMQLLIGEPGAGKTILAFTVGYKRLVFKNQPVFYLDFMEKNIGNIESAVRKLIQDLEDLFQDTSCLLILDNTHLNPKMAKSLFERMRTEKGQNEDGSFKSKVDVLFLARLNRSDKESGDAIARFHAEIAGVGLSAELLKTHELRAGEFRTAVRGITELLFGFFGLGEGLDLTPLIEQLVMVCKDNLWLVTFYLNALRKKNGLDPGCSLDSIDICEELESYYFSEDAQDVIQGPSVFSQVRGNFSSDLTSSHALDLFKEMLLTISSISQLDIPLPIGFITRVITPQRIQLSYSESELIQPSRFRSIVNIMVQELKQIGELVKFEKLQRPHVMFPHSTFASELAKCSPSFRFSLADEEETLEDRCVLLLEYYGEEGIVPEKLLYTLLPILPPQFEKSYPRNVNKWFRENMHLFSHTNLVHMDLINRHIWSEIQTYCYERGYPALSMGDEYQISTPRAEIILRIGTESNHLVDQVSTSTDPGVSFEVNIIHESQEDLKKNLGDELVCGERAVVSIYEGFSNELKSWISSRASLPWLASHAEGQLGKVPVGKVAFALAYGIERFAKHLDLYSGAVKRPYSLEQISNKLYERIQTGTVTEDDVKVAMAKILEADESIQWLFENESDE